MKKGRITLTAVILLVIMCLIIAVTSCGGKEIVPRNVETIFKEGIFESVDLSLSPLPNLTLPGVILEIPPFELPNLDLDINVDIDIDDLIP